MMFEEPGVISLAGEIIDIGINYDTVEKTGNTYTLKLNNEEPVKLGVGRDNAKRALYENKDKMKQAKREILEAFKQSIIEGRLKAGSSVTEKDHKDESKEQVEEPQE